jgi:hypothetical protein
MVLLVSSVSSSLAPIEFKFPCERILLQRDIPDEVIELNHGYDDYLYYFGKKLASRLSRLDDRGHWLDGGAGTARAQREFAKAPKEMGGPRLTAVATAKPDEARDLIEDAELRHSEFHYHERDLVVPWPRLEPIDVITDLFGALTYSLTPKIVMINYLRELKSNGAIFFKLPDSQVPEFLAWLSTIPNVEVEPCGKGAFMITKQDGMVNP